VSENVRVKPLTAELERTASRYKAQQEKEAARLVVGPSAPVISEVLLSKIKTDTGFDLEQNIFFKDAEGDATFVSFVVLGTSANHLTVGALNIRVPSDQQIKGGVVKKNWTCVNSGYFVKLRAYITDSAGNVSRPRDYTLNC
jgi:ribosomal protein L18E